MSGFVFSNFVQTTLAANVSSTATTIELASTADFPTIPASGVWGIILNDAATGNIREIVYGTAISGANVTVQRGQEGTTAQAWLANDKVYACATAAALAGFAQTSSLTGFVKLSPSSQQTGSINVSGTLESGAATINGGIAMDGALTGGTTATFSEQVNAATVQTTESYANRGINALALGFEGAGGIIGVGPSSGLSAEGVTASMLAIGDASTGNLVTMDYAGNLGTTGGVYCDGVTSAGTISAPTINQGSNQVIDKITSTGGTITPTNEGGGTWNIDLAGGTIPVGGCLWQNGTGSGASQALPAYGTWGVEVLWSFSPSGNNNESYTIALTAGSVSGEINTGYGVTAQNAAYYSAGLWTATAVGSQTLSWSLTSSGGLGASGWLVRCTRTA